MKHSRQATLILNTREDNNLSQVQLAEILGVHMQFVSNWERDISNIPPERAKILIKKKLLSSRAYIQAVLGDYEDELKAKLES